MTDDELQDGLIIVISSLIPLFFKHAPAPCAPGEVPAIISNYSETPAPTMRSKMRHTQPKHSQRTTCQRTIVHKNLMKHSHLGDISRAL